MSLSNSLSANSYLICMQFSWWKWAQMKRVMKMMMITCTLKCILSAKKDKFVNWSQEKVIKVSTVSPLSLSSVNNNFPPPVSSDSYLKCSNPLRDIPDIIFDLCPNKPEKKYDLCRNLINTWHVVRKYDKKYFYLCNVREFCWIVGVCNSNRVYIESRSQTKAI